MQTNEVARLPPFSEKSFKKVQSTLPSLAVKTASSPCQVNVALTPLSMDLAISRCTSDFDLALESDTRYFPLSFSSAMYSQPLFSPLLQAV